MGLFSSFRKSMGSVFEDDMVQVAQQMLLSFGKIQEGMRHYLLKYLKANSLPTDQAVIENTFGWLISGIEPPKGQMELARKYVEILGANPLIRKVFSTSMAMKVNMMTSQGLMSEAMNIVKNLNTLRIPVFSLDLKLPNERAFIKMANDFYDTIRDMDVYPDSGNDHGIPIINAERYELRKELGRGAFGVVHLAFDKNLHRDVAIKRLSVDKRDSRYIEASRRFEREAKTIASLNHPNIVQVYDFESSDRGYSIIMEYVRGGSLAGHLENAGGKLSVETVKNIGLQVCDGLAHAHNRGIIHRDLKPQNILIDNIDCSLRAKIVDFGIACGLAQTESLNTVGGLGTPLYMPPEQRIKAREVTQSADIYSLGKILFEMLTGEVGYEVDIENPSLPGSWRCLIERCINRDPSLRYADADGLRNELMTRQ